MGGRLDREHTHRNTQKQRNTHSCRVSTPISLYCSSCFTWASSCFSLESCGHKRAAGYHGAQWASLTTAARTKLLSHDYWHPGILNYVCTEARTHTHTHKLDHTLRSSHIRKCGNLDSDQQRLRNVPWLCCAPYSWPPVTHQQCDGKSFNSLLAESTQPRK